VKEQNDRRVPVSDRLFDCLEDFRNRYGGENQVVVVKLGTQPALPALLQSLNHFDYQKTRLPGVSFGLNAPLQIHPRAH